MSVDELVPVHERWLFTPTKLYSWLVGLAFALIGGVMCTIPVGALLGVPVIALGLFMSLTSSLSMSGTRLSPRIVLPLVVLGFAMIVIGRQHAPIAAVVDSLRAGRTLSRQPSLIAVLGIPLLLMGAHVIQLVTPWLRDTSQFGLPRSVLSLLLIESASVALLVGAGLTTRSPAWRDQPWSLWIGVPLALGLGCALRSRWKGVSWSVVFLLATVTLPLAWYVLVHGTV